MHAHFPRAGLPWCSFAGTITALSTIVATLPVGPLPAARADALGDAKTHATALAQKIAAEQDLVDQLSEEFDGARYHLGQIEARVAEDRTALQQVDAEWHEVRTQVVQEAVRSYTQGGFGGGTLSSGSVDPVVAQSYFALATNRQNDALDRLRETRQSLTDEQAALAQSEADGRLALAAVNTRRQEVAQAQAQAQATLGSVKGQIAALVAAAQTQQAVQQAAQQAQYNAQLAHQQAEATTTPTSVTGTGGASSGGRSGLAPASSRLAAPVPTATPTTAIAAPAAPVHGPSSVPTAAPTLTPRPAPSFAAPRAPAVPTVPRTPAAALTAPPGPPASSRPAPAPSPAPLPAPLARAPTAARAVQMALAQVGKPYQWGAAGPGSFDCSGLVQFAYAAAGVLLPHYTVAQWDDTTHIPPSALQPGDLVFFYSDFHHVGIYLGNGLMVDAPHTGALVRVEPIAGFGPIAGASRVG